MYGVRDGAIREDASRIRKVSSPQVVVILRNITILLFKRLGHKSEAAATRPYVYKPEESLEALSMSV